MARIQILELPEGTGDDRPPFVLIVDEYQPQRYMLGVDQDPTQEAEAQWVRAAQQIGARGVLIFEETVEIPANSHTTAAVVESIEGRRIPDFTSPLAGRIEVRPRSDG